MMFVFNFIVTAFEADRLVSLISVVELFKILSYLFHALSSKNWNNIISLSGQTVILSGT